VNITTTATQGTATGNVGGETAASFGLVEGDNVIAASTTPGTINSANVTTVDNSNQVLVQVDQALQQLATESAQLGAYQNRFQAAITGLNTDSTNLTSARSQIQDTDYASATSALSKAQILQQAGTAMVAQANTIPQNILTLLQKLP
jgi:flagellin